MPRVFISYRRADTAGYAGRLHEYLAPVFGEPNIFMDIDNIPPGEDFIRVIEYAIQRCDVVLVLIGPHWATLTDAQGYRRLHDPHDFVRLEVATALARPNLRVVPVLVNDAPMPSAGDLPADLQSLTRRNAIELSNERFRYDVDRLIKALGGKPGRRGSSPAAYQSPAPRPAAPPQPSAASRGYNRRVWIFLLVLAALYAWFSGEYYRSNPDESLVFGLEFMGLDVLGFNILFGLPALTLILALFWPLDFMTGAVITFVAAFAHLLYVDSLYTDTGSSDAAPLWILVAFAAIHAGLVGVVLIFSRGIRGFFRRR